MRCKRCGGEMFLVEGMTYNEVHPYGDGVAVETFKDDDTWECDCGHAEGFDEDDVYDELDGGSEMTDILCFLAAKNWEEAIRAIGYARSKS